ncbi:MAG: bifunctional metallophosphatase/5'-nucleotidase [Actinomycetia bacterium]|nr:bifunctional metallophosphatase/5'-nucleotidase [Actinomycetes bacterium]
MNLPSRLFRLPWTPVIALMLVGALCLAPLASAAPEPAGSAGASGLRVLFTSDLHSHLEPYRALNESGQPVTVGGYARLATLIKQNRNYQTLVLDAGDFSMGTLYNGIFTQTAPDLSLMAALGFDATTFGNHEFDYGPEALAQMLQSAAKTPDKRPLLLQGNLVFGATDDSKELKAACNAYGFAKTHILSAGGRKVGVFGLLGADAQSYLAVPGSLSFSDQLTSAKAQVAALKAQGAQTIIALSHCGTVATDPSSARSEDVRLAKALPDIDLIISAHSHTTLKKALTVGRSTIVSAGSYGRYLGVVDFDSSGTVSGYRLQEVTDAVKPDPAIATLIAGYHKKVQTTVLDPRKLSFNTTSAVAPESFTDFDRLQTKQGDYGLGTLIADAYVHEASAATSESPAPVTIGVTANGLIRDSIVAGPVTTADAFQILSLGRGDDDSLGYPLAAFYLTGPELRNLAEVDASVSKLMNNAQLYFSGLRYHYSPRRLFLNRVTDVEVQKSDGSWAPARADTRYRVVCSLYMAQMAQLVGQKTHGLLSIQPKDAGGTVVSDLNSCILYDHSGAELKEWLALNNYLRSQTPVDGAPTIPARYYGNQHTKLVVRTTPLNLLRAPNRIGVLVAVIGGVLLAGISAAVVSSIRRRRRRRHNYLFA